MRIIYIPGIKSWEFYMSGWRKDLAQNFPNDEVVFLNDSLYMWWELEKIEKIIAKGVALLDDGKPTMVIGHSFGGIVAKTIIDRAKKSNVTKLITMASPHQMDYLGVKWSKQKLKTPKKVEVPTYTFGSYFDWVVPFKYTSLSDANHLNVYCEHLGFLFLPWIRKKVLTKLKND